MARYRIFAECISDLFLDVECADEDKAFEIAKESDGGEWTEDMCGGEFRITQIIKLDD